MKQGSFERLADTAPELERLLTFGSDPRELFTASQIRRETVWVTMRDGIRLATDLYLPPKCPAPAIAMRTTYGRAAGKMADTLIAFACHGYVVISQDCRGTGDSEPDSWDYYMYEAEDGYDFVEWARQQAWFDGFIGACGGSYVGQTQWCMAIHPCMSTIAPEVSGLGIARNTAHIYMFVNASARSVGKGEGRVAVDRSEMERLLLEETLAGGYFNDPLEHAFSDELLARYPQLNALPMSQAKGWLWEHYCSLSGAERAALVKQALSASSISVTEVEALPAVFGHGISHDAHTLPHPRPAELSQLFHAPPLMITGWYDWCLNDAIATWQLLRREAQESVRTRTRLIIAPSSHNMPGYREGIEAHPELQRAHRTQNQRGLLLAWYAAVRERSTDSWPIVIYYFMGANEWRSAADWPPPEARRLSLYLDGGGRLIAQATQQSTEPDQYVYNPEDPTPTLGGSIVSYLYQPGSVDVSEAQKRSDVLTYTTAPLASDLDVVGPLSVTLYASSSARDTDFVVRLSDVFEDGRAIQLQSNILRARYRSATDEPSWLEPGRVYRLELDLWSTANRFKAGHRLRLDISSADFPRFDRNTNRGGEPGPPVPAVQTIYHDARHPSCLSISVLGQSTWAASVV